MKPALLAMAIATLSASSYAQLMGHVVDDQQRPIANATVDLVGTGLSVKTDANGRFEFTNAQHTHTEIHVKASGFVHRNAHIHKGDAVNVTLVPTALEIVNVVGLPWHASNMESAQPISVLSEEKLRNRQSANLGDTLKYEVGVHSSYFGPVASSPIIRGLDGPRVQITQNGLDAGDASRVGPDHAVTSEASTARQIEILRGPATLFYGSGAIGGVVNIVDDRVPRDTETRGEWRLQYDSVASDRLGSFSGSTGIDTSGDTDIGLHIDGFARESNNYRIPTFANVTDPEDTSRKLANSSSDAEGVTLGASAIMDEGFVGLSYGYLDRQYGLPGHSHGDEPATAYADVKQHRIQLLSELSLDHEWFSASNTRVGFTDYEHAEIENGKISTLFTTRTDEARWELFHHPLGEWRGALSVHAKSSTFDAVGDEAFTPPNKTTMVALGLMEERHFGPVLVQLGARLEHVDISSEHLEMAASHHDHDHDHHDSDHHDQANELNAQRFSKDATPISLSAGLVWDFTDGYNVGLSYTHAERTPSAGELLSYGPHLGSGVYEIGAIYDVAEEQDGGFHTHLNNHSISLETSNNLDISLRKIEGNVGFILNGFFNDIDNFYYLSQSGLFADVHHDHHGEHDTHEDEHHPEEEHHHDEHSDQLPVYNYRMGDARLYGFESEVFWEVSTHLTLSATADYTRAHLKHSDDLPRIPPLRMGFNVDYTRGPWSLLANAQFYDEQSRTAPYETSTKGYALVDMQLSYALVDDISIFVKGNNLTNKVARVHSSFLKDKAPLPARSVTVGISGRF